MSTVTFTTAELQALAQLIAPLMTPVTPPVTPVTPPVTPPVVAGVPKLDFIMSQNGSAPVAGADNWDLNAVYNSTANPYPGHSASVACTLLAPNGGFQPLFVPNGATSFFDTTPYLHLVFSARPTVDGAGYWVGFDGDKDTPDGNQIRVDGKYGPTPLKGQWATYIIPLADFSMPNRTAVFKFGIACGPGTLPTGTVTNFDNVGLSKA